MKSLPVCALACALVLISVNHVRRAPGAHAVFAQQAGKQESAAKTEEAFAVRELDLEGLKKILPPGEAKEAGPLLINFWATWCEPCREEFPDLLKIEADYKKRGLRVVLISLDDVEEIKTSVPQFLREMRATHLASYLLNVPDPEPAIKAVDAEWHGALPATFVFDPQGKLVFKHTGRIKPAELRSALDAIIKTP